MSVSGLADELRIASPDDLYEQLVALGRELSDEDARAANAALVLVLANHIGDAAVLDGAMSLVRRAFAGEGATGTAPHGRADAWNESTGHKKQAAR